MSDVFYLAMVVCGGGRGKEQMCGCCLINAWAVLVGGCVKMRRSGVLPNHQRRHAKVKARSELVHVARTGFFFARFVPTCMLSRRLLNKIFCVGAQSEVLSREHCWLGRCVCVCVCVEEQPEHDWRVGASVDRGVKITTFFLAHTKLANLCVCV